MSLKASFKLPLAIVIPIANHANGVQIACNVDRIVADGGKMISILKIEYLFSTVSCTNIPSTSSLITVSCLVNKSIPGIN